MKKILLLSALVVVLPALAFANSQWEFGPEVSYIQYKEPSLEVKEHGPLVGVFGAFDLRPDDAADSWILNVLHGDAHFDGGSMHYSGSGTVDNIDDYLIETRAWVGRDFRFDNIRVTPYGGFGYRWLYDNGGGHITSTGAAGYDRMSQYIYLPIGAEAMINKDKEWAFGVKGEYDVFLRGWQDSYLSDVVGYPDIHNTQDGGYGLRGSIKIIKKGDVFNWIIEPYVRYWHINQSNTVTARGSLFTVTGYEPTNSSTEIGIRLGAQF